MRTVQLAPAAAGGAAEDDYLRDRRPELYARAALTTGWTRLWRAELASLRLGCVCVLVAAALLKPAARRGVRLLWEGAFARAGASLAELAARARAGVEGRSPQAAAGCGGKTTFGKTTFSQRA